MKSLTQFITEAIADKKKLAETNYGKYLTLDELCCKESGFNDKTIFADRPKECGYVVVHKENGKLIKQDIVKNRDWADEKSKAYFSGHPEGMGPMFVGFSKYDAENYHTQVCFNSKKDNIVILVADPKNNEIVAKVAKEHLDLFNTSSPKLTKEDLEAFEKFFNDHVENARCETSKGTFAVYFADKEDLKKDHKMHTKGGLAHIGISKPNGYLGGFCVTVYYPLDIKWDPKKYPGEQSVTDKEGLPKLRTVDDVCELMLKHLDDWAKDLKFTVKK